MEPVSHSNVSEENARPLLSVNSKPTPQLSGNKELPLSNMKSTLGSDKGASKAY